MLFKKYKKIDNNLWGEAFKASPNVYSKSDTDTFGALALTENTLTILPKDPKSVYTVSGKKIEDWRLALVSTTKDTVIGSIEYYKALIKMKNYIVDTDETNYLIKALSVEEMNHLI